MASAELLVGQGQVVLQVTPAGCSSNSDHAQKMGTLYFTSACVGDLLSSAERDLSPAWR